MISPDRSVEFLSHGGTEFDQPPYSPTLEAWLDVERHERDRRIVDAVMAAAYDAGVYSVLRHESGDTAALDLPIGAAAIDHGTGEIFQGIAQDKELNDHAAHAEVMALRNMIEVGGGHRDLKDVTIGVTLEPCPACLTTCRNLGVGRMIYGASRESLAHMGIVKPHSQDAHDIAREARESGDIYFPDLFQYPSRAIQAACLELFTAIRRDPVIEKVVFDREAMRATRYQSFDREMQESARLYTGNGTGEVKIRPEAVVLSEKFKIKLEQFYKHSSASAFSDFGPRGDQA